MMIRVAEMQAIYVMWLRQLKHFIRMRSRIIASIIQPLFFLLIFGFGFNRAVFPDMQGDYMQFLVPGIITMGILFSSMFAGVSVLWDKQFGFLQEVLVAPVSRLSIIIGRTLGGATTALVQGFIILGIAFAIGGLVISSILGLLLAFIFMVLIAFSAVGFGLIVASKMEDFQGFQIIMQLIIMPLFLLSSAVFPVDQLPLGFGMLVKINPIFYMVDGLRGSLTGFNNIYPPIVDFAIVLFICIGFMSLGSYFFNKSEV